MFEPTDSLDGGEVVTALRRLVDRRLISVEGSDWRCQRAIPRIDGSLYFDLTCNQRAGRVDWMGEARKGGRRRHELRFSKKPPLSEALRPVLDALDDVLSQALVLSGFFLLRSFNRDVNLLCFDDRVVDVLLARRFEPGRNSWFGYRFVECRQEQPTRFQMVFQGPSGEVVFEVGAAVVAPDAGEVLISNDLFYMSLAADGRRATNRTLLPHQVERFVGFLLHRAVHPGMRLVVPEEPEPIRPEDSPGAPVREDRMLQELREISGAPFFSWGSPHIRNMFFFGKMVQAKMEGPQFILSHQVNISHADAECYKMAQRPCWSQHRFFLEVPPRSGPPEGPEWPDPDRLPESQRHPWARLDTRSILYEREVILGSMSKLSRIVERIEKSVPRGTTCVVNCSCTPKLIGADVASLVDRMDATSQNRYLYYSEEEGSAVDMFREHVKRCFDRLRTKAPTRGEKSVNLVGLWKGSFFEELSECLESSGIAINTAILPEFGEGLIQDYFQADLQVLVTNHEIRGLLRDIFEKLELPSLTLPAPFGFKRSEAFVRAIVEAVLPGEQVAFGRSVDKLREVWLRLTERASGRTIGLVINELDLGALTDPTRFVRSLPLLSVLEEMSFRLDNLVVCTEERFDELRGAVASLMQHPDRHRIGRYAEEADFAGLLERADCVYSDLSFDDRITRAGRLSVSSALFEMGFSGAVRTLERILRRCELAYPRKYRQYFRTRAVPLERDVADDLSLPQG